FAVVCAGIFPLFHVGRVWFGWWLFPIPNSNGIWPQFRSPLEWDVFAVSTYGTVSVLFWYMGMIPDLSVLRDRAVQRLKKNAYEGAGALAKGMDIFRKNFYAVFAMGWRNAGNHWRN
ncbi:MAG TPA: hydrogenase, partial [Opitutae bacterium]|nr:hydrogenase [Opitutae bacterium]